MEQQSYVLALHEAAGLGELPALGGYANYVDLK